MANTDAREVLAGTSRWALERGEPHVAFCANPASRANGGPGLLIKFQRLFGIGCSEREDGSGMRCQPSEAREFLSCDGYQRRALAEEPMLETLRRIPGVECDQHGNIIGQTFAPETFQHPGDSWPISRWGHQERLSMGGPVRFPGEAIAVTVEGFALSVRIEAQGSLGLTGTVQASADEERIPVGSMLTITWGR